MCLRASLLTIVLLSVPAVAEEKKALPGSKPSAKGVAFFESKIRPVLVKHCYRCHSAEAKKSRGGLLLDTREALLKGGDSGPALIPKDPQNSLLFQAICYKNDLEMPPGKRLPDSVIADIKQWITLGAPDPRSSKDVTKKPTFTPATDLWCLQPIEVKKPTVNGSWAQGEIDRYVLSGLEQKGLQPVADAGSYALLRRLYFDLTGLPPTPKDIDQFQKAFQGNKKAAVEAIVDRLLQSPQYGERWGRHWLDVARFAESNGKDRDVIYPHAWRYRRYVIRSFHEDKPYDQFVREQLAGDLLQHQNGKEREEHLIATGFLALGPKSFMQRGEQMVMDLVDDQIDTTTRAFLGLTVSCARCHDHKFDPIPTKDYYSLASIFRSTKTLYGSRNKNNSNLLALPDPKAPGKPQSKVENNQPDRQTLLRQIRVARNKVKKLQGKGKANPKKQKLIADLNQQIRKLQAQLRKASNRPNGNASRGRFAMAVQEDSPRDLQVLIRGEINKKGARAPRGFLSAVKLDKEIPIPAKQSGRLQLSQWLTDPSNPLTARVAVNRVWHHLFGRGLVRTVDNFGSNGSKPSHPELLDYLADSFMKHGWSFKKLIREIVLSRAYQLGTAYDEKAYQIDPDNALIWRHSLRRLDVEAIRDAMLQASGTLNLTPPPKSVVTEVGLGEVGRGIRTAPLYRDFPHRSVYMPIIRGLIPEMLKIFDFAEPSLVVGNRSVTTVPSQALYLMNSPFVIDNAKGMAQQLSKLDSKEGKIEQAYQRALSRLPRAEERQRAMAFYAACEKSLQQSKPDAKERELLVWTSFCQALLASAEFRYLN